MRENLHVESYFISNMWRWAIKHKSTNQIARFSKWLFFRLLVYESILFYFSSGNFNYLGLFLIQSVKKKKKEKNLPWEHLLYLFEFFLPIFLSGCWPNIKFLILSYTGFTALGNNFFPGMTKNINVFIWLLSEKANKIPWQWANLCINSLTRKYGMNLQTWILHIRW